MKRIITLILFLFIATGVFAQTDGITYQAVIIGPDALELPGVDSQDNYLPTTDIAIKFSIIAPGSGVVEFTEIQNTTTDEFGRINLIIGAENHDDFEKIDWNGDPKSLKVEVDFNNGDGFVDMSVEKLTYVPYVAHRDITATGTLEVDDDTFLNRELTVNGPTTINSTLNIEDGNPANFSGDLNVDGETNLNNTFNVTGQSASNLSGALIVGDTLTGPPNFDTNAPTVLAGSLDVKGQSTFGALESKTLIVEESTNLNGSLSVDATEQIVLKAELNNIDPIYDTTLGGFYTDNVVRSIDSEDSAKNPGLDIANYPVLVEGSNQGIAIKINGFRGNGTNFISFWDTGLDENTSTMWGRIEGENVIEFENDADYLFDKSGLDYDIFDAGFDVGLAGAEVLFNIAKLYYTSTDIRACFGIGSCVTVPPYAEIGFIIADGIILAGQLVTAGIGLDKALDNNRDYDDKKREFQGVTYASGAGDYAEYLMRLNANEEMSYGDVVGVTGGKISKNTESVERVMIVSFKPIVLGNMPQQNEENLYEKVAFMGQVPVKVYGNVNIGDYIIPSGRNDGIGIAVPSKEILLSQIPKIIGVAWESKMSIGFGMVNVAVGLNRNDNHLIIQRIERQIANQNEEINNLKKEISKIYDILLNGENTANLGQKKKSVKEEAHLEQHGEIAGRKYEVTTTYDGEIIQFEITDEDFDRGMKIAQDMMVKQGVDLETNEFWKKLTTDSAFKADLMNKVKDKFKEGFHYHQDLNLKEKH